MNRTFIIAEAGVNHNGNIALAKEMVLEAGKMGADAVKFQTFAAGNLVSKSAKKAEYQLQNTDKQETQYEMLKKLELTHAEYIELQKLCLEQEIQFLSTPFDIDSIEFLQAINISLWKIPSGEITNLPYLIKIAETKKPVILSTGMSNLSEVQKAVTILRQYGSEDISVLHCNTEYPTPFEDVNLRAIQLLKDTLRIPVGYSDHTPGIEVPVAAAALGARIIEKHFTLDKKMEGPDHKASLEPSEFKAMVDAIRNIELSLGKPEKEPSASEKKNIVIARKSIVAKRAIHKGELLSESNITTKRPGTGLSPMLWFEVLGTRAVRDFEEDELIEQ